MKAMTMPKKQAITREDAQKILRRVLYQEGFRFSTGVGDFTGQVATSLGDFADMLETAEMKSIDFHMDRRDFENWVQNVLGDEELAKSVARRAAFLGESRRKELVALIRSRLDEYRRMLQTA